MIIDLANVGTEPKMIEREFEPGDIDLEGEVVSLMGPVSITGEMAREGKRAILTANVNADAALVCSRCIEPVERHLDFEFRDIFVEPTDLDSGSEAEIADDQLDESLAVDGKIDLVEVVREQLLLAIPEQIFCKDDCRGLCPKCGENLNLIDCKCADDEIDPRWAALKNLK